MPDGIDERCSFSLILDRRCGAGHTEDGWPDISSSRGGHITIPVPLAGLAQVLQAAFGDLAVAGLRLVGTGFGSTVLETGGGIILRIPRTAAAARGHGVEAAVLPVLAPMLPFNVPVPAFFCPPAPGLPFGAIGYPRLAGQPCQPAHGYRGHRP